MNSKLKLALLAASFTACTHAPRVPATQADQPGNAPIRSEYAEGEITQLCNEAMRRSTERLANLVKANAAVASIPFSEGIGQFEEITADLSDEASPLTFMGYVSTIKARRDEAAHCEEMIGRYTVDIFTRKDLYEVVKRSQAQSTDEKRLYSETMRGFRQDGLELPDDQLAELKKTKQDISSLQTQFSKNLNEAKTHVDFTAQELEGCSADFLGRHTKSADGKYTIFANEADYPYVMENAKNAKTREQMAIAYNNRAPQNTEIIQQTLLLREKAARLLKYKSWADAQIDGRMAKDSAHVLAMLNSLKSKLSLANQRDLKQLLVAKRQMEDPKAKQLDPWDISYFANQLKKTKFNVDQEVVRQYFPKDLVMTGLFHVYSTLLGVQFEEVPGARVWSPDVKLYSIRNTKDGALVGYFYVDLFPREGKYGHAASFPILAGRRLKNGSYHTPVAAIVANLTPPSADKPSLLNHSGGSADEVETIFHEFGHIMHQTLTKAPYASLAGSSVAQDFVEAPSQMLENWVWDPQVLALMSGHYKDVNKKLPADLLKQMIALRDFNQGYTYTRQLLFGLVDMEMHTADGPVDVTRLYDQRFKEIVGLEPIPNNHFIASFGHLMGGYDAGYYGYIWSEVYAADMFTIFQKKGLLDPQTGARYRSTILANGRMKDPEFLLREFLGRDSNSRAFYKKLHIK